MARIFLHSNKFHKILPSSLHEGEFENIITLQAPSLYPDYYVIPFKKTVISSYGNRKPDLVFIARDYEDWYIVEVEMAYHSYQGHVEPQIAALANAEYSTQDVIDYMCKQCNDLDSANLKILISTEPPKILLILNELQTQWVNDLKNKYGVVTSVFEIFQSSDSNFGITPPHRAYSISQNYPVFSVSMTSQCTLHPYFAYLGIEDNSHLQLRPGDELELEFEGCLTFWKVDEGPEQSLWLKMQGRNQCINRRKSYHITKLRDETYLLEMV